MKIPKFAEFAWVCLFLSLVLIVGGMFAAVVWAVIS